MEPTPAVLSENGTLLPLKTFLPKFILTELHEIAYHEGTIQDECAEPSLYRISDCLVRT